MRIFLTVFSILLLVVPVAASCPPGHHWWPGGYFQGNAHYPAGTYNAGYYKNVTYSTHVADHVQYRRYVAVVPLVELPTYGSYYTPSPAGMPRSEPEAKPPVADGAKKEILDAIRGVAAQVTTMSTRIDSIESRVKALESAKPAEGGKPDGPKPTDPFKSAKADAGLQLLHSRCASCHDASVAKAKGGEFVLFVTKDGTASLAKTSKSGLATDPLSGDDLKNAKRKITKQTMPPKKDGEGKALPEVPEEERKAMVAWLEAAIKEGEKK